MSGEFWTSNWDDWTNSYDLRYIPTVANQNLSSSSSSSSSSSLRRRPLDRDLVFFVDRRCSGTARPIILFLLFWMRMLLQYSYGFAHPKSVQEFKWPRSFFSAFLFLFFFAFLVLLFLFLALFLFFLFALFVFLFFFLMLLVLFFFAFLVFSHCRCSSREPGEKTRQQIRLFMEDVFVGCKHLLGCCEISLMGSCFWFEILGRSMMELIQPTINPVNHLILKQASNDLWKAQID